MPYYYAHYAPYGVGTTYQTHDGRNEELYGTIYRFKSRKARDEFVAGDVWDGRYHLSAVPASAVRSVVARYSRRYGPAAWETEDGLTRLTT